MILSYLFLNHLLDIASPSHFRHDWTANVFSEGNISYRMGSFLLYCLICCLICSLPFPSLSLSIILPHMLPILMELISYAMFRYRAMGFVVDVTRGLDIMQLDTYFPFPSPGYNAMGHLLEV